MLYPILTPSRLLIDLGGTWDFKPDAGRGFSERWYASPLTEPLHMPVPASYNDLTESEELREHCGWVFYQRRIAVPALAPGQRVVLRCEAVTHHARTSTASSSASTAAASCPSRRSSQAGSAAGRTC